MAPIYGVSQQKATRQVAPLVEETSFISPVAWPPQCGRGTHLWACNTHTHAHQSHPHTLPPHSLLQRASVFQPSAGPASNSFENPRRTGFMTKHGGQGFKANWKRRYFVLDSGYLFYYASENVRGAAAAEQRRPNACVGVCVRLWEVGLFCSISRCFMCGRVTYSCIVSSTRMHAHTCNSHACMHACTHTHNTHTHTHTHTHAHTHTTHTTQEKKPLGIVCLADYCACRRVSSDDPKSITKKSPNMIMLKAVAVRACAVVCVHPCVCVRMYVFTCVCICVCMVCVPSVLTT